MRFEQHNNGESQSTKPFRPYKLIFYEAFLKKHQIISDWHLYYHVGFYIQKEIN